MAVQLTLHSRAGYLQQQHSSWTRYAPPSGFTMAATARRAAVLPLAGTCPVLRFG